jgi:hypothetical protein
MSQHIDPSLADAELLDLAQVVLHEAGYVVRQELISGTPYLLAEDPDNVVVLGAVIDVADILVIEPALSETLVNRLAEGTPESKKWDGYVIILTSTRSDEDTTEALFSLTYNLSQVRRIVRIGVEATKAAIARGLRPVLPLRESTGNSALADPLVALEERLIADGLAPTQVSHAMASFRAQAPSSLSSSDDDVEEDPDATEEVEDNDG